MKTVLQLFWSVLVDFATNGNRAAFGSETKDFLDELSKKRTEERIANWPNTSAPSAAPKDDQGKLKITIK
jgi:hypothetical protein